MTLNGSFAVPVGLLLLAGQLAFTQAYPTRPVRLVAPFSAGGGADTVARLIGQKMSELLTGPARAT